MVSVARLDDDFNRGICGGKVDEVVIGGGGGVLEVGPDGGGGATVFAVPDGEFLELLYAPCRHDFIIITIVDTNIGGAVVRRRIL